MAPPLALLMVIEFATCSCEAVAAFADRIIPLPRLNPCRMVEKNASSKRAEKMPYRPIIPILLPKSVIAGSLYIPNPDRKQTGCLAAADDRGGGARGVAQHVGCAGYRRIAI